MRVNSKNIVFHFFDISVLIARESKVIHDLDAMAQNFEPLSSATATKLVTVKGDKPNWSAAIDGVALPSRTIDNTQIQRRVGGSNLLRGGFWTLCASGSEEYSTVVRLTPSQIGDKYALLVLVAGRVSFPGVDRSEQVVQNELRSGVSIEFYSSAQTQLVPVASSAGQFGRALALFRTIDISSVSNGEVLVKLTRPAGRSAILEIGVLYATYDCEPPQPDGSKVNLEDFSSEFAGEQFLGHIESFSLERPVPLCPLFSRYAFFLESSSRRQAVRYSGNVRLSLSRKSDGLCGNSQVRARDNSGGSSSGVRTIEFEDLGRFLLQVSQYPILRSHFQSYYIQTIKEQMNLFCAFNKILRMCAVSAMCSAKTLSACLEALLLFKWAQDV